MMKRVRMSAVLIVMLSGTGIADGIMIGLTDDFSAAGVNGWSNQASSVSNPGTGGVGGTGDGFLNVSPAFGRLGAFNSGTRYKGNFQAAGIQAISLYLNDVGGDDDLEFHMLLSDDTASSIATTWLYTEGFSPPENSWQPFSVDVTDSTKWTKIRGSNSFEMVLQNVQRLHFRHDLAPYVSSPDNLISGDLGVDEISLVVPEPSAATILSLCGGITILARKRSKSSSHN